MLEGDFGTTTMLEVDFGTSNWYVACYVPGNFNYSSLIGTDFLVKSDAKVDLSTLQATIGLDKVPINVVKRPSQVQRGNKYGVIFTDYFTKWPSQMLILLPPPNYSLRKSCADNQLLVDCYWIEGKGSFTKCGVCVLLKELTTASTNPDRRKRLLQKKTKHIEQQQCPVESQSNCTKRMLSCSCSWKLHLNDFPLPLQPEFDKKNNLETMRKEETAAAARMTESEMLFYKKNPQSPSESL
eukprot:gene5637-10858_t